MIDIVLYLIYFITGLIAGVVGGLLGTGGCSIMMPVIRFGFNFPSAIAVGTTLTAVVFTAASGAYQNIKIHNMDKKSALWVGIPGILGVIIGSILFGYIINYGDIIDLIIGLAFILVAVRMLYEGLKGLLITKDKDTAVGIIEEKIKEKISPDGGQIVRPVAQAQTTKQAPAVMPGSNAQKGVLGVVIGVLTGIIGLGGGYALVPSFIYLFKSPVKLAMGTSMAAFVWMALVGAIFKLYQGVVNIPVAVVLGIGAVIGAIYGVKLMSKIHPDYLKSLFGVLFLYVSLKYILFYFGIYI
jgi:uncharacterized membrane protein YfcA